MNVSDSDLAIRAKYGLGPEWKANHFDHGNAIGVSFNYINRYIRLTRFGAKLWSAMLLLEENSQHGGYRPGCTAKGKTPLEAIKALHLECVDLLFSAQQLSELMQDDTLR